MHKGKGVFENIISETPFLLLKYRRRQGRLSCRDMEDSSAFFILMRKEYYYEKK